MASKEMEQLKTAMKTMMKKGFAPKFDGTSDPIVLRNVVQSAQERMPAEPGIEFIEVEYGGIKGEINLPVSPREDAVIIYIHGGGLICGNAFSSRGYASVLANEAKIPVYTLTYRLAPEYPFPAAVEDCFNFYKGVLEKNPEKPIFLIGESGGAYLSITTAMKCRDNGVKLPKAIVPYSAPIDFTGKIDRHFDGNKDFTITPDGFSFLEKMYIVQEQDMENIYASPYLDDFHGLCPFFLAWDESESLAVDQKIIVEKLNKQGIECKYLSYPDCFHAFATAARGAEESREVLKETIAFFEKFL